MERVDRLERLTNLVLVLLDARRPVTLAQIATMVAGYPEGHQARRQAFERDKRTLREEGIPISVEPVEPGGQLGYRIRPEDYYLPDLGLSADEQVALNLAVAGVHLDDASGLDASLKLGFIERDQPAVAVLPRLPTLPVVYQAIRERAPIGFKYRSRERELEPYGVLFRNGFWYMMGHDRAAEEVRTYRLDRVEGEITVGVGGSFEPPESFDPVAHFPSEPWLMGDGQRLVAEVQVEALAVPVVTAQLGEEAVVRRCDDGSVVVQLEVTNRAAFRSWVLGLLEHARVLGPPELREELRSWLEATAKRQGGRA
jgi:predicted DNA-binding transcriptional regulator YafY